MKSTSATFAAQDGTPLFWHHWEPERNSIATVCLCHGLGEHLGRYEHVARALTDARLSLLGFDLRGHGRSGGARGHAPSYAHLLDDLDRVIHRASNGGPVFLYGHSMGGNLALNYGLDKASGLRGIVVTGPWLRLRDGLPAARRWLARVMARVYPRFTTPNGLDVQGLSRDPDVVRAYVEDPLVHDRITAMLGDSIIRAGEAALARASSFRLPALLMQGEDDPIISLAATQLFFDRMASQDKTLRIWAGLRHEIHNEPEQADVIRVMVDWYKARL